MRTSLCWSCTHTHTHTCVGVSATTRVVLSLLACSLCPSGRDASLFLYLFPLGTLQQHAIFTFGCLWHCWSFCTCHLPYWAISIPNSSSVHFVLSRKFQNSKTCCCCSVKCHNGAILPLLPSSIPVKNSGPLLKAKNTNNNTKLAINSHYFFQRQLVNICIFSYKYHFLLAIRHETKNTFWMFVFEMHRAS